MDDASPLSRYRPLVPDWAAFRAVTGQPLPTCLVAHPERVSRSRLAHLLVDAGIRAEAVGWHPHALKTPAETRPGRHWSYVAGLFLVQEEAALLPVVLLDPRPGERVLDLCAAPGNKMANMAIAMDMTGTLIANEPSGSRLAALRQTVKRMGLVNVSLTRHQGQDYPLEAGPFDRVLVDAPCSGEGTSRRAGRESAVSAAWRARRQAVQCALLRRAVALTRAGGRIVYATCTYAPEENEAVVGRVLDAFGHRLRVLRAGVPGLATDPGLGSWAGASYPEAVRNTLRLWPHRNDTGGFYCAVLERLDGPEAAPPVRHAPPAGDEEWCAPWVNRFGLPLEELMSLRAVGVRGKYAHVAAADHDPPAHPMPVMTGLPMTAVGMSPPKPTTAAVLRWGRRTTRHHLVLDVEQALCFLKRELTELRPQQCAEAHRGYVIVSCAEQPLGIGVLEGRSKRPGRLRSLFPAVWAPGARIGPENAP